MTLETILQLVRDQVSAQAQQENGPDLDTTLAITGNFDDDPTLDRVLEVKGELIIKIARLPKPVETEGLKERMQMLYASATTPPAHVTSVVLEGDSPWA